MKSLKHNQNYILNLFNFESIFLSPSTLQFMIGFMF